MLHSSTPSSLRASAKCWGRWAGWRQCQRQPLHCTTLPPAPLCTHHILLRAAAQLVSPSKQPHPSKREQFATLHPFSIALIPLHSTALRTCLQVYVSERNLDDDLVRSISLPAQDPNAAEVFYRVITGAPGLRGLGWWWWWWCGCGVGVGVVVGGGVNGVGDGGCGVGREAARAQALFTALFTALCCLFSCARLRCCPAAAPHPGQSARQQQARHFGGWGSLGRILRLPPCLSTVFLVDPLLHCRCELIALLPLLLLLQPRVRP